MPIVSSFLAAFSGAGATGPLGVTILNMHTSRMAAYCERARGTVSSRASRRRRSERVRERERGTHVGSTAPGDRHSLLDVDLAVGEDALVDVDADDAADDDLREGRSRAGQRCGRALSNLEVRDEELTSTEAPTPSPGRRSVVWWTHSNCEGLGAEVRAAAWQLTPRAPQQSR